MKPVPTPDAPIPNYKPTEADIKAVADFFGEFIVSHLEETDRGGDWNEFPVEEYTLIILKSMFSHGYIDYLERRVKELEDNAAKFDKIKEGWHTEVGCEFISTLREVFDDRPTD